jgi:acyl-CoA synthetase (AMP-forming)/AMP-acid ligase II
MLLHTLANGGTLVSPASNRPVDALEAMNDFEVTHASGTPTFWRLLVGMLDETSANQLRLRQITLGGEPSPEDLLIRLRSLFPEARISHVYAGSEFGSVVSVSDGKSGLPLSVLAREGDSGPRLRIVDGELQVRSASAMLGYFGAEDREDEWWPTGDLVEVREDRVHFVGRATDAINVGGAKVNPLPIEEVVARVKDVTLARVYGRSNPVTGQIVALDVVPEDGSDPEIVEREIRAACESLPAASRPRRIRFVDSIELRGHKMLRRDSESVL